MEEKNGIICKVCDYARKNWKKFLSGALMIAGLAVGAEIVINRESNDKFYDLRSKDDEPEPEAEAVEGE